MKRFIRETTDKRTERKKNRNIIQNRKSDILNQHKFRSDPTNLPKLPNHINLINVS